MLCIERRVAAVEGRLCVSYLNRWTEGSSINSQSGWPACGLRVETRTLKKAFVLILVNVTSFSKRSCDVCFGMPVLYHLFQQIVSQTVVFPANTRTDIAMCLLFVHRAVLCRHALGTLPNSATSICLLKRI
jgi:hypothetical protein